MASLFKQRFVYYQGPDGGRVPAGTRGARKVTRKSKKWYGKYRDAQGALVVEALSPNKEVARQMLSDRLDLSEREKVGWRDRAREAHEASPLSEHLDDWQAAIAAGGATESYARRTASCARRLFADCGFARVTDIAGHPVGQALARLRAGGPAPALPPGKLWFTRGEIAALLDITPRGVTKLVALHGLAAEGNGKARAYPPATVGALIARAARGASAKTCNQHLDAARAFCSWLVKERRLASSPLEHLEGLPANLDRRHERRALTVGELGALVAAALASRKSWRGLAGPDRAVLYRVAVATGLRAGELAHLTPASFDLAAELPACHLAPEKTKNGKGACQPLPADLVRDLAPYLAGRPPGAPVWPGPWWTTAAPMIRIDLAAAGVPYVAPGRDGTPLHADFHSLRHSFIALLDKAGATLKEAMQLARHSDPKLTMAVYGKARLHDLAGAVNRLPALSAPKPDAPALTPILTPAIDSEGGRVTPREEGAA